MTILPFYKLALLAALALLGLSATSPVSAAPILSPQLIPSENSDLSPGSSLLPSSQPASSSLRRRRNSKLYRRKETGVPQDGGNEASKIESHAKGIFGLEVNAEVGIGGGNESKKHGGDKKKKEKKHGGGKEKKKRRSMVVNRKRKRRSIRKVELHSTASSHPSHPSHLIGRKDPFICCFEEGGNEQVFAPFLFYTHTVINHACIKDYLFIEKP